VRLRLIVSRRSMALVSRNATMLSNLCLKEFEARSSGKVWEASTVRLSVKDILGPDLFVAAAAATAASSATPKGRVLGQIQPTSPALSKAALPSTSSSALVDVGTKQARPPPIAVAEPESKKPAAAATAAGSSTPMGRVLGEIQTTSPALFKAAAPSTNSSALDADSKKQARPEPKAVEEPASKKPAAAATAAFSSSILPAKLLR